MQRDHSTIIYHTGEIDWILTNKTFDTNRDCYAAYVSIKAELDAVKIEIKD
jgi:hypothetical protein